MYVLDNKDYTLTTSDHLRDATAIGGAYDWYWGNSLGENKYMPYGKGYSCPGESWFVTGKHRYSVHYGLPAGTYGKYPIRRNNEPGQLPSQKIAFLTRSKYFVNCALFSDTASATSTNNPVNASYPGRIRNGYEILNYSNDHPTVWRGNQHATSYGNYLRHNEVANYVTFNGSVRQDKSLLATGSKEIFWPCTQVWSTGFTWNKF